MQNIKDFLNSKETFEKVLTILKEHDTKNDFNSMDCSVNFIAGGSVSNILISMIHGGKPVINDIDVYKEVKEGGQSPMSLMAKKHEWYPATYVNEDGLEMVDDSYGRIFVAENGAKMRVVRHLRKNIFNIIEFLYDGTRNRMYNGGKTRDMVILEGFDLNCCKAGIDVKNGKIIYTSEFVDYLETKQLRIVTPCAPIQTTIRLYNKMRDLDCFCDVEHEMRFLTAASKHIRSGQMVKYIGPETHTKYLKTKEFVDKYFKLREPANSEEIPHSLKETYYIGNKRNPDVNIWLFEAVMDFNIIDEAHSINNFKRIWELLYTYKRGSDQDKIHKIYYKNFYLGKKGEDQWESSIYKGKDELTGEPIYETIPYYHSNRYTYAMILSKKDYYKCDFSIKHVDYIDNFAREHHGMRMFLKDCKNVKEQYELIKFIKSLAKKEGDWIIGSLETSDRYMVTTRDEENKLLMNDISKETILKLIEKFKRDNIQELTVKLDLSNFEYKNCVRELTTTLQLKDEGSRMGHCVGGYSDSIKRGDSRIFHIDCDGIGSTVEIKTPRRYKDKHFDWFNEDTKRIEILEVYQPNDVTLFKNMGIVIYSDGTTDKISITELTYGIRQHHGRYPEKGNLKPTETNENIVKELVGYLNLNNLPDNYKIRREEKKEIPPVLVNEDWF
jgi:hypothetical protein